MQNKVALKQDQPTLNLELKAFLHTVKGWVESEDVFWVINDKTIIGPYRDLHWVQWNSISVSQT